SGGTMTNQNVHISTAGTYDLGGNTLVLNALTTDSSTITFQNGTIRVFSGSLVNWDAQVWNGANLDFGSNTGYLNASWSQVFKGTSQITGSGGLVVSGLPTGTTSTTFENTSGNPFTGGLTVNGTTSLGFNQDNQLGAAGGNITLGGGLLSYNAAANLTIS